MPGIAVSEESRQTSPLRRKRSIVLGLLVITGVINYLDRSTLSIADQHIREELGLSFSEMGTLLSAFSWSYAFAQLPTGALVDRVGPRILLAVGLAIWSVAQACGGLVTSMRQFVGSRIVLGIGEAPQFPTGAARGQQLVPRARARIADGHVQFIFKHRAGSGPPALDGPHGGVWMEADVFHHGGPGTDCCRGLVRFLSRPGASGSVGVRSPVVTRRLRLPPAAISHWPSGCGCSGTERPGEWCSALQALST